MINIHVLLKETGMMQIEDLVMELLLTWHGSSVSRLLDLSKNSKRISPSVDTFLVSSFRHENTCISKAVLSIPLKGDVVS